MKIWVIMAVAAVAFGQTPPAQQAKSIVGEVTAVDSGAKQISVKTDSGSTYSVKIQDNTAFLRMTPGEKDIKKAAPIAFADVAVGDRVAARGAVSEEDKTVPAKNGHRDDQDGSGQEARARPGGLAEGRGGGGDGGESDAKEITVTSRGANPKPVVVDFSGTPVFLRYAPVRRSSTKPSRGPLPI